MKRFLLGLVMVLSLHGVATAGIYAFFTEDGQRLISFFDDSKNVPIPAGAIPVSDAVFREELANPGKYIKSGNDVALRPALPPPTVDSIRPDKIVAVKSEALRRILLLIPGANLSNYLIKENNLQARVSELIRKEYKATITTAEQTELDYYDAIWQQIKAIRAASDSMEAEINALATYDAVNTYNIATNILWP